MAFVEVAGVVAKLGFVTDSAGARKFEKDVQQARLAAAKPITQHVKVESEKAERALRQIDADHKLLRERFAREEIVVGLTSNLEGLKKELSEAERVVGDYDKRIAAKNTEQLRSLRAIADARKKAADEEKKELELLRKTGAQHAALAAAIEKRNAQEVANLRLRAAQIKQESGKHDDESRAAILLADLTERQNKATSAENAILAKAFNLKLRTRELAALTADEQASSAEKEARSAEASARRSIAQLTRQRDLKKALADTARVVAQNAEARLKALKAENDATDRSVIAARAAGAADTKRTAVREGLGKRLAAAEQTRINKVIANANTESRTILSTINSEMKAREAAAAEMDKLRRADAAQWEKNRLARLSGINKEFSVMEKLDRDRLRQEARNLHAEAGGGGRRGGIRGVLPRFLGGDGGGVGLRTSLGPISGSLEKVAGLAAVLLPLLAGVGGALVALAGSFAAAAAGAGALGVALGSTLIPLGLVAVGVTARLGKITDAWTAMQNQQLRTAHDSSAAADTQAAAAERIKSANQSLADADRGVQGAQDDLTEARFRARRELQDLRTEVDRTALSEERASMSLNEAIVRLHQVRDDPNASSTDLLDARLSVKEARASVKDAERDRRRANEDAARGVDTVKRAEEQLGNAKRSRARASAAVVAAEKDTQDATAKTTAGADLAAAKLAQLTAAERGLLQGFVAFSKTFTNVLQPATDSIFTSVTKSMVTVTPLLKSFRGRFKDLGDEIGSLVERGAKSIAGPEWSKALDQFAVLARRAIKPLGEAFGSVLEVLKNIAIAAGPSMIKAVKGIRDFFGNLSKDTSDAGVLRDLIKDFVRHTKDWLALLGSLSRLLITVFGGGADEGDRLANTLTHVFNRWNDFLNTGPGQEAMRNFFEDAVGLTKDIAMFIKGFAIGIHDAWVNLKDFVGLLGDVAGMLHLKGLLGFLSPITDLFGRISVSILGIDRHAKGWESVGKVLATIAALKFLHITKLLGLMLGVGKGAAGIAMAFKAMALAGGAKAATGGVKGAIFDLFKGRGDTVTKPLYVLDVAGGGGGKGVPGVPPVVTGGGLKGAARAAGRIATKVAVPLAGLDLFRTLVNSQTGGEELEKLTQRLDALASPSGGGRGGQLREIARAMEDALKKGDHEKVSELADDIARLAGNKDDSTSKTLRDIAEDAKRTAKTIGETTHRTQQDFSEVTKNVKHNWTDLRDHTHVSVTDIRKQVASNTLMIKERLGKDTLAGTLAARENFRDARKTIRETMSDAGKLTRDGVREIRRLLVQELEFYGVSPKMAVNISQSKSGDFRGIDNPNPGGGHQSGGWLGARGAVGSDTIPLGGNNWAAPGEYYAKGGGGSGAVLNRHQVPIAEMALLMTGGMTLDTLPRDDRALGMLEGAMSNFGGLDNLFATVTRPHMYAKGGSVSGAASAAERLEKAHFPYVWGGGHQSSPAPFGPMDCSGAVSFVLQRAGVNIPTMVSGDLAKAGRPGPGALTVYANAGHTLMRIGQRFFGTSRSNPGGGAGWIPNPGEDYLGKFAVRHFLGGEGLGAVRGAHASVRGGGAVGATVQRALDITAGSARRAGNRALRSRGLGRGDPGDPGPGVQGSVVAAFRRAARASGANATERLALFEAGIVESGLRNLGYGDRDSVGALQQRPSQGWTGLTNPYRAALEFLSRAIGKRPWRGSAGQLAQSVQGSAFPERYDQVAGQARRYVRRGGKLVRAFGGGGRSGKVVGSSEGLKGSYEIGHLPSSTRDKIKSYDTVVKRIGTLEDRFVVKDRKFGLSQEEFITDSGLIDEAAIRKRAGEISALIRIREAIVAAYDEAVRISKTIMATYREVLKRLRKSLKHGTKSKKERRGVKANIADYEGRLSERVDMDSTLKQERRLARLDVTDLENERGEVLGTAAKKAADDAREAAANAPTGADFIDRDIAAATLTPGNADDIKAAEAAVAFYKDELRKALLTPDPRDDTAAISQLTSAQSALDALKGGSAEDKAASLEQSYQQGLVVGRRQFADYNTNTVLDFAGDPSKIGMSTPAKIGAPLVGTTTDTSGVTVNVYALHPADSSVYDAIGRAATIGQGQQGSVTSPRVILGT